MCKLIFLNAWNKLILMNLKEFTNPKRQFRRWSRRWRERDSRQRRLWDRVRRRRCPTLCKVRRWLRRAIWLSLVRRTRSWRCDGLPYAAGKPPPSSARWSCALSPPRWCHLRPSPSLNQSLAHYIHHSPSSLFLSF